MTSVLGFLLRLCVGPFACCGMVWATVYGVDLIGNPVLKQEIEFGIFGAFVGAAGAAIVFECLRVSVISLWDWRAKAVSA